MEDRKAPRPSLPSTPQRVCPHGFAGCYSEHAPDDEIGMGGTLCTAAIDVVIVNDQQFVEIVVERWTAEGKITPLVSIECNGYRIEMSPAGAARVAAALLDAALAGLAGTGRL